MRKYSVLVLAVALLFAMGMMAQTSTGSSSSSQYPTTSDQPATQSDSQTDQSGAYGSQSGTPSNQQPGMGSASQRQSGSTGTQTDSSQNGAYGSQSGSYGSSQSGAANMGNTANKGKSKTVEGCVVRRETDYFIYPKNGQPEHVSNAGQDVSAHLGHHVKLHGTEQPSSTRSAYGTSGGASGTAGNTSASTSSTGNLGANTAGVTGNASSASGSVNESDTGAVNNNEIVVDRIDMVSESCPSNIQRNASAAGLSTSRQ